jgi:hypothetical protein
MRGQRGQLEILTGAETERLAVLEATVDAGVQTFIDVGNALAEIRDSRLYRQTHARFADYLRERWDMSRAQGYRLIDAASVAGLLVSPMGDTDDDEVDVAAEFGFEVVGAETSPMGDTGEVSPMGDTTPPPSSERVARKLAATAKQDPKRAQRIWKRVVREHGPGATAAQVAAIANGHPPAEEWEADLKALASDLRRVCKRKDAKDAKRALVRWRGAYAVLDRIAKGEQ